MNFSSDNVVGVCPEIFAAMEAANQGAAPSYGEDAHTAHIEKRLKEIFECDLSAFPMVTGTACNALALSVMSPPYGAILCHTESHINTDECGAVEMYSGGVKLIDLAGENGRLSVDILKEHCVARRGVHSVQPAAISVTQVNEFGVVYPIADLVEIGELAKSSNLFFHMDGARFANAVVSLGCRPSEMTWRAGIDILSLGATKNGAMAAELLVCFNPELAKQIAFRRMRAGHLLSKMRFVSAQLEAYFTDDLWLKNAGHANRMAKKIETGLRGVNGVKILFPVDANELFVWLPPKMVAGLRGAGFMFYDWPGHADGTIRLVTAWNTLDKDVDGFLSRVAQLSDQLRVA